MKQVLVVVVVSLILHQTSPKDIRKEHDLEKRLRDLTESEEPLALERGVCSAHHVKVGCFKDNGNRQTKVLNELLFTDRDLTDPRSSGKLIDWHNFGVYLKGLVCRCAEKAKAKGYTHFGVQYYGECLSAPNAGRIYNRDGRDSSRCVNQFYQPCNEDDSQECVGKGHANFIYKIPEEGSGGGQVDYAYDG